MVSVFFDGGVGLVMWSVRSVVMRLRLMMMR